MKCIEKMEYWATCRDSFNKTAQPSWTGKVLGERAFQKGTPGVEEEREPMYPPGSWAGQDCSQTKHCNNNGFTCNKKTDTEAYCVQAMTVSTWGGQPVPLPEGWNGEKLGDWQGEYQVQGVPEDQDMAGTSFYCIMAVLPDSNEIPLLMKAKENNASIFGCDAHSVYRAFQTNYAGWDTAEATVVNTNVFLQVMDQVKEDKIYLSYDWTVKVDADCVFLADRLRSHLWGLRPPPNMPLYVKNTIWKGPGTTASSALSRCSPRRP